MKPFHFIVRFIPIEGCTAEFRKLMIDTAKMTRMEVGCLHLELFESVHEPTEFSLRSVWTSEEAFERHANLPHTERFVEASKTLLTHPIKGMRLWQIDGEFDE